MHQMSPVFNQQQSSAFEYEGTQAAMLASIANNAQYDQPHIHHTNLPRIKQEPEKMSNKILDLETKHIDRAAASMANWFDKLISSFVYENLFSFRNLWIIGVFYKFS